MKSIKAALLTGIIIVQTVGIIHAGAAVSIDNWTSDYVGDTADRIDRTRNYIELNDASFYEGGRAAAVSCPDSVEGGALELSNNLSEELTDGSYTFTFYARGNFSANYTEAGLGDDMYTVNKDNWTITSETGADTKTWKKYEKNFDYTNEGSDDTLRFRFSGYTNGCLLDNISLVKKGSDENLVQNGGFEAFDEIEEPTPEPGSCYVSEQDPMNIIASPFSGGLGISWKNPAASDLKSIALYQVDKNGDVLLANDFSTTPEMHISYKIKGLLNGSIYQYKLHLTYLDGSENEYFVFGTPSADEYRTSNWTTYRSVGELEYTPVSFGVDSNESYDGEASIKYVSNIQNTIPNVYGLLSTTTASLELGADYKLSFYAKAEDSNFDFQVWNNWKLLDGNASQIIPDSRGTYNWKEFTINIKETTVTSISLQIILNSSCDALWFDDFTLYKVVDGEITGDNLLSNGSFELDAVTDIPAAVKSMTAEGGDETVTIKWATPGGCDRVHLCQLTEDGYCSRGYISGGLDSITISNLINDTEHTFGLAAVNKSMLESEMNTVSVITVSPDFKVYKPKIAKGNAEAEAIEPGVYTVTTRVKNNKIEEPVPVIQTVAVYRGDAMVAISSVSAEAEKTEAGGAEVSLISNVTIPEEDYEDYHLEIFIWDSRQGMKSLYDAVIFN